MEILSTVCCFIYYVSSAVMEMPSIIRVLRRKSSSDYSIAGILLNLTATVSWSIYIYMSVQTPIVYIGTATDLATALLYTIVMFRYHKTDEM